MGREVVRRNFYIPANRHMTLPAGAANQRHITAELAKEAAEGGADVPFQSAAGSTIWDWQKTTEAVNIMVESADLRQAILANPDTRFWGCVDLSPDQRGWEQFGCMLEYAGCRFSRSSAVCLSCVLL